MRHGPSAAQIQHLDGLTDMATDKRDPPAVPGI